MGARIPVAGQIVAELWQSPFIGNASACDVRISSLRRKLERDSRHPARITVRQVGRRLVAA